ncbi:Imidazolonepropionase [Ephemeroptericola cinctiostellae]|uniref:Imidazolonepropionase n=1 Tax=Ephemeroptericola cinctiostellae TaxID=2268024 RepID=A0A345DCP8_9BURK|nr:imidazolonepropionase [Ephemeroptericola cinctiostellae]AXF86136.1 Imidazolonepropionase [Ephemeroptericola cinctiostellae]
MDNTPHWDALWRNVHLATMTDGSAGYGEILNGALAVKNGQIAWLGAEKDVPAGAQATETHDGQGAWLTPGLIDCHSHIVYAGNRSNEFEARLNGVAYEAIARAGGGILSTVNATRAASFDDLLAQSLPRVKRLLAEGVTTLEIKSGYGLDLETEAKMLRVARHIGDALPVTVRTTFLGAHAVPLEYKGRADDYVTHVCEVMLPALHAEGLVDAVDAFCENIGFSATQTERVFKAAAQLNLPVKLHAEQLSDQNGAALVGRFNGLSADHLEHLSDAGITAMAAHGTVAVLLPGAYYFLRETKLPPVQALREAGVPMAVSTDCNPGTSPMTSLLLAMNMACTMFKMTPQEALAGTTVHAARALGLHDRVGQLAVGQMADLALWQIDRPADLAYAMGQNMCAGVVKAGRLI